MNVAPSVVRTGVPVLVGVVVSFAAAKGIHVSPELEAQLVVLAGAAAGSIYHWLVRVLEERWPRFGWLLGFARAPHYEDPENHLTNYVSTTKYDETGQVTEITTVYRPSQGIDDGEEEPK